MANEQGGRLGVAGAVRQGPASAVCGIPCEVGCRDGRRAAHVSVNGHSDEIFWTEALDIYNAFHVHLA